MIFFTIFTISFYKFTIFDNFWQLWQFSTIVDLLTIVNNDWQLLTMFDYCWQCLTIMTISDHFFWQFQWQSRRLVNMKHWLQFWQLRTWILTWQSIKSDTGQNSQFLRCLFEFKMKINQQDEDVIFQPREQPRDCRRWDRSNLSLCCSPRWTTFLKIFNTLI